MHQREPPSRISGRSAPDLWGEPAASAAFSGPPPAGSPAHTSGEVSPDVLAPQIESPSHAGGHVATHKLGRVTSETIGGRGSAESFPKMYAEVWVAAPVTARGPPATPSRVAARAPATFMRSARRVEDPPSPYVASMWSSVAAIAASAPTNSVPSSAKEE